mgnify:CR=1 FL=1
MEIGNATAAFGSDNLPRGKVGITGVGINFRALTEDNFGNFGSNLRQAVETIN